MPTILYHGLVNFKGVYAFKIVGLAVWPLVLARASVEDGWFHKIKQLGRVDFNLLHPFD